MHVICQQAELDEAIRTVSHAIATRPTLPVLSHILLHAEQNRLRLSATNLEMGINLRMPAEVSEEGVITLPAKLFADLVHNLQGGNVELHCSDQTTTTQITGRHNQAHIKGLASSEFPTIPTIDDYALPVSLEATLLKEMISQVAFASADDENRSALSGVLIRIDEHTLTLAAADSYRLAVRTADLADSLEAVGDVLVPANGLRELARILPPEGTIEMRASKNRVLFHSPTVDLVSRVLTESFPPYEKMIPESYVTRAIVDTKAFAAIVRSTLFFARENANILRLSVGEDVGPIGNGYLIIEATSEEFGDSTSTLAACIEGPGAAMTFNAQYLADALAAIDTPEVALELTHPTRPGVIRPAGSDAPQQVYIVMPMHVQR